MYRWSFNLVEEVHSYAAAIMLFPDRIKDRNWNLLCYKFFICETYIPSQDKLTLAIREVYKYCLLELNLTSVRSDKGVAHM